MEKLDEVVDQDGQDRWRCHDLAMTGDRTLYGYENDHPYCSSYLGEIVI